MRHITYKDMKTDLISHGKVLTPPIHTYSINYMCKGMEVLTKENTITFVAYAYIMAINDNIVPNDINAKWEDYLVEKRRAAMSIKRIAENIRIKRICLGLTQGEVARRAGIGSTTFTMLENGRTNTYKDETLRRIARALKIDINSLKA